MKTSVYDCLGYEVPLNLYFKVMCFNTEMNAMFKLYDRMEKLIELKKTHNNSDLYIRG